MRRLLRIALLTWLGLTAPLYAAQDQIMCLSGSAWIPCDSTTPFPVTSVPSASTGGVAYVSTTALAANKIIKAGAGNLYSFNVGADSTLSAAAWWIMIYDLTAAPTDGAVTPAKCYPMPSGTTGFSAAFTSAPLALTTGITIGVSTTGCFTKTASTHAFISGDAK